MLLTKILLIAIYERNNNLWDRSVKVKHCTGLKFTIPEASHRGISRIFPIGAAVL